MGTKFGCGMGLCGACTVHVDGAPIRSCSTPVSALAGKQRSPRSRRSAPRPIGRKVQQAWLDVDVMQCGYCQAGQLMTATRAARAQPAADRCATSTRRWPATSAAAPPTRASAPRSSERPGCRRPTRARADAWPCTSTEPRRIPACPAAPSSRPARSPAAACCSSSTCRDARAAAVRRARRRR